MTKFEGIQRIFNSFNLSDCTIHNVTSDGYHKVSINHINHYIPKLVQLTHIEDGNILYQVFYIKNDIMYSRLILTDTDDLLDTYLDSLLHELFQKQVYNPYLVQKILERDLI